MLIYGPTPEPRNPPLHASQRCACGHADHDHSMADALSFRSSTSLCEWCACLRFRPTAKPPAPEPLTLKKRERKSGARRERASASD